MPATPGGLEKSGRWRKTMASENTLMAPERKSKVRVIASRMRKEIFSGKRPPGSVIASLDTLALELDADVSVVHEALASLSAKGLIELRPDETAYIPDWRKSADLSILGDYFWDAPHGEEKAFVAEDLLYVRRIVLSEAAGKAAIKATYEELDCLQNIAEEMRGSRGDTLALVELDLRFLHALVDATHSLPIRWMANSVFHMYEPLVRAFPNVWAIQRDHFTFLSELLRGLRARDQEETRGLVRAHFERSDAMVISLVRHYAGAS